MADVSVDNRILKIYKGVMPDSIFTEVDIASFNVCSIKEPICLRIRPEGVYKHSNRSSGLPLIFNKGTYITQLDHSDMRYIEGTTTNDKRVLSIRKGSTPENNIDYMLMRNIRISEELKRVYEKMKFIASLNKGLPVKVKLHGKHKGKIYVYNPGALYEEIK